MLVSQKEKGELSKYTKKERLLIDREIENLQRFFLGIVNMKEMPKALFVVDSKREHIAVTEAHKAKIPVIALVGSDCNIKEVEYPIPGNDTSVASITFFLNELINAYKEGRKA
ncbi:30S ribosomal protein S2, partial [Patescibacteria group bacterium]|nr:30S ribosomal protein S2 [Patescibacteria group bacterium]